MRSSLRLTTATIATRRTSTTARCAARNWAAMRMARNAYGGYCRECGRWTPPGFGHFERRGRRWLVHCVECASGRKLPPEGDVAAQDMQRHVENMKRDGRYGKRGYR